MRFRGLSETSNVIREGKREREGKEDYPTWLFTLVRYFRVGSWFTRSTRVEGKGWSP